MAKGKQSLMSRDLLIELGTEELPSKSLLNLVKALATGIEAGLKEVELSFSHIKHYATPRRLAVLIKDLAETTPQRQVTLWGPPEKVAFDSDGEPTKAGLAFAKRHHVNLSEVTIEFDGKTRKLVHRTQAGGRSATALIEALASKAFAELPVAKRMRWGANRYEFLRPVHWLVVLYGDEIIDANILGVRSGRLTHGHRFHRNLSLNLPSASDYEEILKSEGFVVADFEQRRDLIRQQVVDQGERLGGFAIIDDALLDEVTALVEWPVALTGKFEKRFLQIPPEALISSMKIHQKYFHMVNGNGELMPNFITVANIESSDPDQVIDGNERVIRPRLSDAAFFFETDKKSSLFSKRDALKNIIFQAKLGSVYEKTERIANLAVFIANNLGDLDSKLVERAGHLCKADLTSNMVCEFTDMQGIAGYYYAQHDGEPTAVATAIKEHYLPRFAGDELPKTEIGAVVALADRLDTLVGIFGIGEQPTGSKDPFALRRASLAVLRLLIDQKRDLDISVLLTQAYRQYRHSSLNDAVVEQVMQYMFERFRAWYEERSIPSAVFQSVNAKQLKNPLDIDRRVRAVDHFRQLPEAEALAIANKRVGNLLAKSQGERLTTVDEKLLLERAEKKLSKVIQAKQSLVDDLLITHNYQDFLKELASLRQPVDDFFDQVMVMAEEDALRHNRLALLQDLRNLFLAVADISYLASAQ
ncbi:MAG: glycyl-tRNA synthetase beta chain [Cellvibrionaceae bacterium]|jgi:glycyl-tRNA synthetase beta chain